MLPVNCNLTITNFDATNTFRWGPGPVFLLDVFPVRSFITVSPVWPAWDPAEVSF